MTEFEKNSYGMSEANIRRAYIMNARKSNKEMVIMGILSDCQEMLQMSNTEDQVRRQLNVAKFLLSEMMEAKEF